MKAENDQLKLMNDLSLALGTCNHCAQGSSRKNSGVGANAASEVDMTFVANDSLSELVWSPHKGLSLRRAGSLPERKPLPLWVTGSSDMVLSPSHNIIIGRNNVNHVKQEDMISLQTTFPLKIDVAAEAAEVHAAQSNDEITRTCRSDSGHHSGSSEKMEGMKNDVGVYAQGDLVNVKNPKEDEGVAISNIHTTKILDTGEANWPCCQGPGITGTSDEITFKSDGAFPNVAPAMLQFGVSDDLMIPNSLNQNGTCGHSQQKLPIEGCHLSELRASKQCKHPDASSPPSRGRRHQDSDAVLKEVSKTTIFGADSTSAVPLYKMESTALNHLQPSIKVASNGFDCMNESCDREEQVHLVAFVASETSPTIFSASLSERKGKGKALSEGYVNGRTSRGNDDSDESVESCNSSGVFGGEKKCLLSFEQQLIVGKRLKQQSQESPCSVSLTRHDNSFMNWISNMVHGVAYHKKDKVPSLALIHVPPPASYKIKREGSHNEDQVLQDSSIGFTSFFRALYLPKPKLHDRMMMNAQYETQQTCREHNFFKMPNCDGDSPSCVDNQDISKSNILFNVSHNQSPGEGLIPDQTSDENFASFRHLGKAYSSINRYPFDPASGTPGEWNSHHSSLGKRKTSCSKNDGSSLPSDVNTHNIVNRSDPLHSSWITRFSSKTSSPFVNSAPCKQSRGVELGHFSNSANFLSNNENCCYSPKDHKCMQYQVYSSADPLNTPGVKVQNCAVDNEARFCLRTRRSPKISPLELSQRFRCSEALASIFSLRLDALKHILSSESCDSSGQATATCFYCGIKGHDLQDCSKLTEPELEELLYNIRAYGGAEESPCLCIRCFQLNHWAVVCPNASSRKQFEAESGGVCLNHLRFDHLQDKMRTERNSQCLGSLYSKTQVGISCGFNASTTCHKRPSTSACLDVNLEMDPVLKYSKRGSMSDLNLAGKGIGLSFVKSSLQASGLSHDDGGEMSDVPGRIFEAIKRLRLTRMDVLKWINSAVSNSQLDGYYLRLRLAKCDQGIGITGYHVACITAAQGEGPPERSKKCIFANVGGIRCLVESQYISNQDFQEDELVAWWSTACRAGGKLPSEEDLGAKVKERVRLGL